MHLSELEFSPEILHGIWYTQKRCSTSMWGVNIHQAWLHIEECVWGLMLPTHAGLGKSPDWTTKGPRKTAVVAFRALFTTHHSSDGVTIAGTYLLPNPLNSPRKRGSQRAPAPRTLGRTWIPRLPRWFPIPARGSPATWPALQINTTHPGKELLNTEVGRLSTCYIFIKILLERDQTTQKQK